MALSVLGSSIYRILYMKFKVQRLKAQSFLGPESAKTRLICPSCGLYEWFAPHSRSVPVWRKIHLCISEAQRRLPSPLCREFPNSQDVGPPQPTWKSAIQQVWKPALHATLTVRT